MTVTLYEVGGCVRDELLGVSTKDIDYSAVVSGVNPGTNPYAYLRAWLYAQGFTIFTENPEFLTIRAHFPKGWNFAGRDCSKLTADFVLARRERDYTDGRRPDTVEPGTLEDDLRRRDFSINAMAKDRAGNIIDLFNGKDDLDKKILRAVGNSDDRICEDALRALRAIRFHITKNLWIDDALFETLNANWLPELIQNVAVERRQQELYKCFKHDTLATMNYFGRMRSDFTAACFSGGLWLEPTLRS